MINVENIIEEQAISLKSSKSEYDQIDIKKIRFGLYLAFLKKGYFSDSDFSNHELLENTPVRYLPCDHSLVDDYHLSTPTVRSLVLEFSEYCCVTLSPDDASAVREIVDELPLTVAQINSHLLFKNVVSNSISASAFCELAEQAANVDATSFRVYPVSDKRSESGELGVRKGRYEREAVVVVSPQSKVKKLKALFPKLVRACEKMSALTYATDMQCAVNLKANILSKRHLISLDTMMAVLQERNDFAPVSSTVCILSGAHSSGHNDFISTLIPYVRTFGSVSTEQLTVFFRQFFDYRLRVGSHRLAKNDKNSHKEAVSAKVSALDFAKGYSDSFFSLPVVIQCLEHSGYFVINEGSVSLSESAPDVPINSYWREMLLHFVHDCQDEVLHFYLTSRVTGTYERHIAHSFSRYCAQEYRKELVEALRHPDGFFYSENGRCYIDDECSRTADNHRGEFIEPEASNIDEMILRLITQAADEKQKGVNNFDQYKAAVDEEWNSKKRKLSRFDMYMNDEFVDDLRAWLTNSHYQKALTTLRSDSIMTEQYKAGLLSRVAFVNRQLQSDGNHNLLETLERLHERIKTCDNRIAVNQRLSEEVLASDRFKNYMALVEEIDTLKDKKQSLKISGRAYKASLFIHDFIRSSGGSVSESDVESAIHKYIESLLDNTTSEGASWYNNGHMLISTHPYSIPPWLTGKADI